ncbi:MAG: site-specific integrase [Pirellulales bacterium]
MATPKKRTKRGWQRDQSGCVVVQFTAPDGKRRTLRLGSIPDKNAAKFVVDLRELCAVVALGHAGDPQQMNRVTEWVATLGPKVAEKLVEFGLVRAATPTEATKLGPFIEQYLSVRNDVKEATATFYAHTKRNLLAFFGADRDLSTITKLDARAFKAYLLRPKPENPEKVAPEDRGEGLSPNTMRRRVTMASQFFGAAVEGKILESNPFRGVGETVRPNKERMFFIVESDAMKVLEACPSMEWRLVFALARWGGLRTPSETDGLKWDHMDWANQQFLVHSPKTEHHEGKETRWMPFYNSKHPELWSVLPNLLRDAWEQAEPGSEYVLGRLRGHSNFGTTMKKIIERAGVTTWPKTFQNLRSTRATELIDKYPIQNVAEWMGHAPEMLLKHYAQLRTAMFEAQGRAAADQEKPGAAIALQSGTTGGGQEGSGEKSAHEKTRGLRGFQRNRDGSTGEPSGQYRTRTCDPYRVKTLINRSFSAVFPERERNSTHVDGLRKQSQPIATRYRQLR